MRKIISSENDLARHILEFSDRWMTKNHKENKWFFLVVVVIQIIHSKNLNTNKQTKTNSVMSGGQGLGTEGAEGEGWCSVLAAGVDTATYTCTKIA